MTKIFQNKTALLIICAALYELFLIGFLLLNNSGNIPLYMFIYFESFLLFFFAYFLIKRIKKEKITKNVFWRFFSKLFSAEESQSKLIFIIFFFGILFRLTLLQTVPTTSPDVYRYLWEGKVVYNGFNPYVLPPSSSYLSNLHSTELPSRVEYKDIPAIYPPFSQVLFAINHALFGESVTGLKFLYLIFEIIAFLFLVRLLRLKNIDQKYSILYFWLPLPIMEYFVNAHVDVVGIMFLLMFIYFMEKDKPLIASVPFAFACLTKLYPIMLFPLVIKKAGPTRTIFFIFIAFFFTFSFYFPFAYGNPKIFSALYSYLSRWEFNGSIFQIVKSIAGNGESARIICGAMLMASVGFIAINYKDFTKAVFYVFLSFFIFAATIYPWYLGWLAALNPVAGSAAAFSFFFTINLTNLSPLGEVWKEYIFVLIIQYIPFYFFLGYELYKKFKIKKDTAKT